MKKNYLYKIFVLLIVLIFISACSKSSDTATDTGKDNPNFNGDFKMPDAMGEITDITGNQITLKEIKNDMPNRGPNGNPNGGDRRNATPPADFNREDMPTRTPTEYTGKTLEIIIPSGMKVTQMSRGEDGNPTTEEINISELKNGDILSINYASDGKTLESVSLSNGMGGKGGFAGKGGFGGDGPTDNMGNGGAQ